MTSWPRSDVFISWCLYIFDTLLLRLYCWFWTGKCLLGAHVTNLIYPRAEWRHRSTVFIFNFEHISHLVLVLLLLILSMYLIARLFIINFNANWNVNLFYLLINEINSYILACSKALLARIVTPLLDLILFSIFLFKNSNIRIKATQNIIPLKIAIEKYKPLALLSKFYTTSL